MSEAEQYKECFVLVDRENAVKLPEDSFFICDIVGCSIFDENGILLGELTKVLQTGSNDVYVVKDKSGKEILIPALKSVVRKVSVDQRRIDVIIPKGLLDDEV
jgi:16S rRNA processing protein RimM